MHSKRKCIPDNSKCLYILNLFTWDTVTSLKFKCELNYVTCDVDAFSDPRVQAYTMNVRSMINLDF